MLLVSVTIRVALMFIVRVMFLDAMPMTASLPETKAIAVPCVVPVGRTIGESRRRAFIATAEVQALALMSLIVVVD